jgi:beta-mannan synthase
MLQIKFVYVCTLQKVSLWKKIHVIYSFFFVRKVIAHINTFVFYCIVLPATVLVPEVAVPKWGAVYIPSVITLLNAVGTPRSLFLSIFLLQSKTLVWIYFYVATMLHVVLALVCKTFNQIHKPKFHQNTSNLFCK